MSVVPKVREPRAKYFAANFHSLLRDFELFATASGAVSNLRKLILALAVGGKLVVQNSSDEPARTALARSLLERQALRSLLSGKPNRYLLDAPLANGDGGALPRGWVETQLGQLVLSIKSGGTPSKQNPSYWDGAIPWASVKDLKFGAPIFNTQDKITKDGLVAGAALAEKGSIIICTRMGLGKIGEAMIDIAINQDLKAIKLGSCIDKNYFIIFFQTLKIVGSGMTVAGIKQEELLAYPILLPPLAEQRRIVARVEELMKLCDILEARGRLADEQHARLTSTLFDALAASESAHALAENWQRIAEHFDLLLDRPEAIDALEETIVQLAVRGLLVPQDARDEPASHLVESIGVEKDALIETGQARRERPLMELTKDEFGFIVPATWKWVRLEQLSLAIVDCPHSTPKFVAKGELCVDTNSFKGGKLLSHKLRFVDAATFEERNARLVPEPGDLVFAREGSVGESLIVPDGVQCCLGQRVMLFRFSKSVSNEYVRLSITSKHFLNSLLEMHKGIGAKHVNVSDMRGALVPLPPLAEQHRIVTRVEELRHHCAQLRERLTTARRTQSQLADALVADISQ